MSELAQEAALNFLGATGSLIALHSSQTPDGFILSPLLVTAQGKG